MRPPARLREFRTAAGRRAAEATRQNRIVRKRLLSCGHLPLTTRLRDDRPSRRRAPPLLSGQIDDVAASGENTKIDKFGLCSRVENLDRTPEASAGCDQIGHIVVELDVGSAARIWQLIGSFRVESRKLRQISPDFLLNYGRFCHIFRGQRSRIGCPPYSTAAAM